MARVHYGMPMPTFFPLFVLVTTVFYLTALPAVAADPEAAPQELPDVTIVGSSPVVGTGVPVNLYPGNAQIISGKSASSGAQSVSDVLNSAVGSVNLNDTEGNPYQMDLNYRGYTASPILGTPQGLSVYVDGLRVNEPFGDIVSWDLIPQIAISSVTVIPGTNPVYGLNTLGGSLAINTKSGFAYPGTNVSFGGGSSSRRTFDAEYGGHEDNMDFYMATSFDDDDGWAKNNPSLVRQLFGKVGYQNDQTDVDLSIQYVDDYLAGNQLVAHSMIEDAVSGYTHPDYSTTRNFAANLQAKYAVDKVNSIEGNLYYRNIWRQLLDSNINDPVTPGSSNQPTLCNGLYGEQCAGNVASVYTQDIYGFNLQYSNVGLIGGFRQFLSTGINAENGRTALRQAGQDAVIDSTFATIGDDPFISQSNIRSSSAAIGLYATDTLILSDRASATLSARYDHAKVDLSGTSLDSFGDNVSVDGSHSYSRVDPSIGGTYTLSSAATLFANYAEGLRTPSAIELACADASHPCAGVPSAFSSDPDLKAVVAKSYEVGARGQIGEGLSWRGAFFLSNLTNDILFNQSTLTTGFFSNVGQTRREGIEGSLNGRYELVDYAASATWLDATYQSSFIVSNGANPGSDCPGASCVPVHPGDKIPGIPSLIGKLQIGYQLSPSTHVGSMVQAQSSTYARGDENNLATFGKIPGFYTVKVDFVHKINETFQLSGGVTNLFNRLYANFGMLSNNDLRGGFVENFWAVGQPRTIYVALKGIF